MKLPIALMSLVFAGFAHATEPAPIASPDTEFDEPTAQIRDFTPEQQERCNDAIREVRHERGLPALEQDTDPSDDRQPLLDRRPAMPDEGLLIAAVEQSVDGCPVLVMHNDKSDWRPVPEARAERVRVIERER